MGASENRDRSSHLTANERRICAYKSLIHDRSMCITNLSVHLISTNNTELMVINSWSSCVKKHQSACSLDNSHTSTSISEILRQSRHRRYVDVSGIDDIMQSSDYDDAPVDSRRPVHRFRRYRRSDREEGEDVGDDNVSPRAQVEGHAVTPSGPAAREQGFVAETLVEDAADAYDI